MSSLHFETSTALCFVEKRCLFSVVAGRGLCICITVPFPLPFTEGKIIVEREESQRLLSSNDRLTGVKGVKVPNDKGRHSTLPSISLFNAIDGYRFFILTSSHCSDQQGTCCWRSVLKSCGGHLGVE